MYQTSLSNSVSILNPNFPNVKIHFILLQFPFSFFKYSENFV